MYHALPTPVTEALVGLARSTRARIDIRWGEYTQLVFPGECRGEASFGDASVAIVAAADGALYIEGEGTLVGYGADEDDETLDTVQRLRDLVQVAETWNEANHPWFSYRGNTVSGAFCAADARAARARLDLLRAGEPEEGYYLLEDPVTRQEAEEAAGFPAAE